MDQREIDAELASAGDLLEDTSAAHLAYTGTDGTPRVVPVGFYWTGAQIVVSTAATAPKVAALRAHRELYDQMARIAITPTWVRYYDFGAGRLPRFLQELTERSAERNGS